MQRYYLGDCKRHNISCTCICFFRTNYITLHVCFKRDCPGSISHGWHLQTVRGTVSNLPGNEVSFMLMIDSVYLDFVLFHHKNRL